MPNICKKCKTQFPFVVIIEGQKRNLGNRKYCLECSPFGKHNTKQIDKAEELDKQDAPCKTCGRLDRKKQAGRSICYVCYNNRREEQKLDRLHQITGNECWVCKYDKGKQGRKILDFHHMNPSDKEFELNARNVGQLGWSRILEEAQKCAQLCCRCHRELHSGLIDESDLQRIYKRRWKTIKARRSIG